MKKLIAVAALGAFLLSGCALFDNPQDDLNTAEVGFSTALALYNSICASNTAASICTIADKQEAATLEQGITDAINAAQVVMGAGGSSASISTAIQSVVSAVGQFTSFVNQLQSTKALGTSRAL